MEPALLKRTRRTPALKGMSLSQRRRTVAGAFGIDPAAELEGRTIVLVDDVLTTGSTANACARALQRAGAGRVEFFESAEVDRIGTLAAAQHRLQGLFQPAQREHGPATADAHRRAALALDAFAPRIAGYALRRAHWLPLPPVLAADFNGQAGRSQRESWKS